VIRQINFSFILTLENSTYKIFARKSERQRSPARFYHSWDIKKDLK
jgi:hypothetical protein